MTNDITQGNITNWLEEEAKSTSEGKVYTKLPTVQFVENKIVTLTVDFSKPFEKWTGDSRGRSGQVTKAIIPCTQDGQIKNWWLNIKNPIYAEIIRKGREGKTEFKIIQIGTQATTQYKMVE
jgi:hypothetical protein